MSDSKRQQKFSKMIQKELSEIFQHDNRHAFDNAFITVTEVEMSPDLSVAKVYLSLLLEKDRKTLLEKIEDQKSNVRGILGRRIGKQVRIVPELVFYLDETLDNAQRIEDILSQLDIPPASDEDEEDEES